MIEVELPDGSIAEFPAGTSPDIIKSALQRRFGGGSGNPQARQHHPEFDPSRIPGREPQAPSRMTAALSGAIEGIPIAGPYLRSGVENVASGIGSLISDRPRSEVLGEMRGMVDEAQTEYPWTSTAAGIGGAVAGTVPMIMAAPTLFGAGAGGLGARTVASGLSGAAIGGADSAVRSNGDPKATGIGALAGGGLGALGPTVGKAMGAGWQRLRDFRAARAAAHNSGIDRGALSAASGESRDVYRGKTPTIN